MKRTIVLLTVGLCAIINHSNAALFTDDFEDGTLDQWTIGGRQDGRESTAEIVIRHSSHMAHLYQDGFTDINISKTFNYQIDLNFSFDMETLTYSEAIEPDSPSFAAAGVSFYFLDDMSNELGVVRYVSPTSTFPIEDQNPLPNKHVFQIDGTFDSYSLGIQDILSNITIDLNELTTVQLLFGVYTSGNNNNMSAYMGGQCRRYARTGDAGANGVGGIDPTKTKVITND